MAEARLEVAKAVLSYAASEPEANQSAMREDRTGDEVVIQNAVTIANDGQTVHTLADKKSPLLVTIETPHAAANSWALQAPVRLTTSKCMFGVR